MVWFLYTAHGNSILCRNMCVDGVVFVHSSWQQHTVSQYVCRWCGFCTQLMATEERCDCLHKFIKGRIDLNLILSKKIVIQGSHIVWEIGVQMVCVDFVHSS